MSIGLLYVFEVAGGSEAIGVGVFDKRSSARTNLRLRREPWLCRKL